MTVAKGLSSRGSDRAVSRFLWFLAGYACALVFASMMSLSPAAAGDFCNLTPGGGQGASADGAQSLACGSGANADGDRSTAIGDSAGEIPPGGVGTGGNNTFVGNLAGYNPNGSGNTAVGAGIPGAQSVVGAGAHSVGDLNSAFGVGAGSHVEGDANTAVGTGAGSGAPFGQALVGNANSAFGSNAGTVVQGDNNVAFGTQAGQSVNGDDNIAIGNGAGSSITANRSISLGSGAIAGQDDAVAIGAGTTTTRAGQVSIGSSDATYTLAGIGSADSLAAQDPTSIRFVTSDSGGNLALSAFDPSSLATSASVTALDSRVTSLEDTVGENREEARGGTALALAAASLRYDDRPEKLSIAGGVGHFKGLTGLSFGVGYATSDSFRINGAIAGVPELGDVGFSAGLSWTLN